MDPFIVILCFCLCAVCAMLGWNGYCAGLSTGKEQATRQMQNDAVTRGYGEFYVKDDELKFRWVCKTIVLEEGE